MKEGVVGKWGGIGEGEKRVDEKKRNAVKEKRNKEEMAK